MSNLIVVHTKRMVPKKKLMKNEKGHLVITCSYPNVSS